MQSPTLILIGMPLDERAPLPQHIAETLRSADIVIGESLSVTKRRLGLSAPDFTGEMFLLDHSTGLTSELRQALATAAAKGQRVALFSDCGLPVLFDPGAEVVDFCRSSGFVMRTIAGPASWALACAATALQPPFLIQGFLPREKERRLEALNKIKPLRQHTVLMEAPYRFEALLGDCRNVFGPKQKGHLAWDIALENEWHAHGSLDVLAEEWKKRGRPKGEYILTLEAQGASSQRR